MLRLRQTQQARASQTRVSGDPGAVAAAEAAGLDAASDASGVPEWALKGAGMWVKGADTLHGWWNPTLRNARQSYDRMVATGAQARGHSAIEYTPGQSARWNAPLSTADLEQVGMSYGVKPAEALREAAGLSSAMGRRTSAGTYDFARASQTYFGVDMGTTGGLMRGLRTAGGLGGQEEQADAVAELIGSAVARGLEGSEIGEYLSTMAGFMRKQEQMGQSEQSLSGFMLGSERLRRMGFSGEFATSYAMRLGEGASQMGYSGGVDAVKFGLLQQLGYGTGGQYTAEDYAEATLRLQDPETATIAGLGAMGKLSDSMRSSGMSPAVRALMMSRYSGLVGAQVGPDAARRMAAGVAGAGYYETPTTAADITGVHTQARGHAVGILAGEASMEAGRIGAGYKAAGQVQALNGVMIDLANTVQNTAGPALDTLTAKLKQMSAAAASWTPGAGSGVGGAGGG